MFSKGFMLSPHFPLPDRQPDVTQQNSDNLQIVRNLTNLMPKDDLIHKVVLPDVQLPSMPKIRLPVVRKNVSMIKKE